MIGVLHSCRRTHPCNNVNSFTYESFVIAVDALELPSLTLGPKGPVIAMGPGGVRLGPEGSGCFPKGPGVFRFCP